jgi:hypothetical protein
VLLTTVVPSWLIRAPEGHSGRQLAVPSWPFKQPMRTDPMLHTSTLLGAPRRDGRFAFAALFLAVALAGCGHDPLPTAPSTTQPTTGSLDVAFTVYDSAKGPIRSFKKQVPTVGISATVTLDASELGGGIDAHRFVVRAAHQGDRLGAFVAATRIGTLEFPTTTSFGDLDVFVMNASNGTDYNCADVGDTDWNPSSKSLGGARYGTIRLAGSGETFVGQSNSYAIQDGSDSDLIQAVKDVNSVLNPFGLAFARMDYVGRVATASISAGWSADIPPNWGFARPGVAVPWIAVGPDIDHPASHGAYVVWIHELLHAWQNAPDYYHSRCSTDGLNCLVWDCAGGPPSSVVPLSPQGRDIVRYWTLMSM